MHYTDHEQRQLDAAFEEREAARVARAAANQPLETDTKHPEPWWLESLSKENGGTK